MGRLVPLPIFTECCEFGKEKKERNGGGGLWMNKDQGNEGCDFEWGKTKGSSQRTLKDLAEGRKYVIVIE